MTLVKDESEDQVNVFHQYNQLTQERAFFNETVDDYLKNAASCFNQQVMKDLGSQDCPERVPHTMSRISVGDTSKISSTSKTIRFRQAEAMKAWLALWMAEQDKQRRIEAEMKIFALERKQGEITRQWEMEREEFERIKKLESLKMQAESELAQARSKAALMDLEAQLVQQMEEVESRHGLTLQDTDATTHAHESW